MKNNPPLQKAEEALALAAEEEGEAFAASLEALEGAAWGTEKDMARAEWKVWRQKKYVLTKAKATLDKLKK